MDFSRTPRSFIVLFFICVLLFVACINPNTTLGATEKKTGAAVAALETGLSHAAISLLKGEDTLSFRIKVESSTYAVSLRIQSAGADLTLSVKNRNSATVWRATNTAWNKSLMLYRMGNPALEDGDYIVTIKLADDYIPIEAEKQKEPETHIDFDIDYQIIPLTDFAPLALSTRVHDSLQTDHAMFKAYQLSIAPTIEHVRVDIFGSQTDTDLFVELNHPFADPRIASYAAQTWRSRESLELDIPKNERAKDGFATLYIVVLSEIEDADADFSLIASPGTSIPLELQTFPDFSKHAKPGSLSFLQEALDATVELIADNGGGSGCVISPTGWILTNMHVLRRPDGSVGRRVSVGFSTDYRSIPDSQFWAELVDSDDTHDLALLHIVSGFYGQKIPADYHFPAMRLAPSTSLGIGDSLYFAGYPTIGGLGNRATLTCTQGMVSGFQQRGGIGYIKTAAAISPGNSGGSAIDTRGSCVGIPSMVVGADASQIAYIIPTDVIPVSWFTQAGLR